MKYHFIRNIRKENALFRSRMWIAITLILFMFGGLLTRMFYLQIIQHDKYVTLSDNNRIALLAIPPNRGLIYDRKGVILADSAPTYTLMIVPEQSDNLPQLLKDLSDLVNITEVEKTRFYKEMRRRRRFEGVPLLLNITEAQAALIEVNNYRLPGANVMATLTRQYPKSDVFAHLIGYVGRINEQELKVIDQSSYRGTQYIGKTGIEKYYEDALHGTVGFEKVETDVRGRVLRKLETINPVSGASLYLTIDSALQMEVEHIMEGTRGAIVAIDPDTGAILAFLSHPTFDPNLFIDGIDHATYKALSTDIDQPLFNRALRGQYPPASTVKPLVALQVLQKGVVNTSFKISDPGYYQLPNSSHVYRDWMEGGHGTVNISTGITESCDTFFYTMANKMGIRLLSESLMMFGYGRLTGVDIYGEIGGLVPTPEWKRARKNEPWYPGETLITGIGQGFTMTTPIQLAQAAAILAAQGKHRQVHVVSAIEYPNGERVEIVPKELPPLQIDDANWAIVKQAMINVVHSARGTARYISNSPYLIAGKTGTAQVFRIAAGKKYNADKIAERLRDHSLFIGFAPADNPKIAVAVVLENKSGAARIARKVFDAYLIAKAPEPEAGLQSPPGTPPLPASAQEPSVAGDSGDAEEDYEDHEEEAVPQEEALPEAKPDVIDEPESPTTDGISF